MKRHIFNERLLQDSIGSKIAKKNSGHWQRGFTLVKLMGSIVIIAIITTIAISSNFGHSMNKNLNTADRNIQAGFFDMKEKAMAESTMYGIIQPE
jgi:Tfp pilus assembly protein FimT